MSHRLDLLINKVKVILRVPVRPIVVALQVFHRVFTVCVLCYKRPIAPVVDNLGQGFHSHTLTIVIGNSRRSYNTAFKGRPAMR